MDLPKAKVVNGELFAGITLSFDLRYWLDEEKTQPRDVESFKGAIYANGEELLDLDEYATIDDLEANVFHIVIPGDDTKDLATVIAQWQGVTTFADGETAPAFVGKLQIWGSKVE